MCPIWHDRFRPYNIFSERYLDDVQVCCDRSDHVHNLKLFLQQQQHIPVDSLLLNVKKCEIAKQEVKLIVMLLDLEI